MYDLNLQVRFWRGISDAMLHGTQASLAAASAWQDEILKAADRAQTEPSKPEFRKSAPIAARPATAVASTAAGQTSSLHLSPAFWWLGPWQAMITAAGSKAAPMCAPFTVGQTSNQQESNPLAWMAPLTQTPWMQMFWHVPSMQVQSVPMMQPADFWALWGASPAKVFAGPFAAFWPWSMLRWDHVQSPMTAMFMSAGLPFAVASPTAKASTAALDAATAAREQMDKMYSTYRSDGGHAAAQIAALPWTIAASIFESASAPSNRLAR